MRTRPWCSVVAVAALAGGCSTPYMARSGPVPVCDTTREPWWADRPDGVCSHQLSDYQRLMEQIGYHAVAAEEPSRRSALHHWARMRSDTTDVLKVEFAVEWASYSPTSSGASVLRIAVSGRSFLMVDGRERAVKDQSDVRRDVDDVTGYLRELFVSVRRER